MPFEVSCVDPVVRTLVPLLRLLKQHVCMKPVPSPSAMEEPEDDDKEKKKDKNKAPGGLGEGYATNGPLKLDRG